MAHNTTVAKVASDSGSEVAISWADHIITVLEHEVRDGRRTEYVLAGLILQNDLKSWLAARELAEAVLALRAARRQAQDEWEPVD